jgi:Fe-S cluster assembly iron-binding protein IscA
LITITDAAKQALHTILRKAEEGTDTALRLTVSGDGELELIPDIEQPGDVSYDWEGRKVVLFQSSLEEYLDGVILDAKPTLKDPILVISNWHDEDECCDECEGCCSHSDIGDCSAHGCCDDVACN